MAYRRIRGRTCWLLAAVVIGCSNVNRPLNGPAIALEKRALNHTRAALFANVLPPEAASTAPDESRRVTPGTQPAPAEGHGGYFVGLALSGGGSRSANFAAACMFQLQRVGILQHVDYISTVSGGTLTGAYYCLNGAGWNPGAVQEKLSHAFASDLIGRALLPWNSVAFFVSDWDRSDVLAGVFKDTLFSRNGRELTFGDLRPDRPRLLINATDLQSGRRFIFSNESFDELNSDLSRFPISYAVAASSAVPLVLHPVTLRDYSTKFNAYRHLIDGGISDNLGVQTLIETYEAHLKTAMARHLPDPYPKGIIVIVIDAHTRFNADLATMSDVGIFSSLKAAAGLSSTSLLNRASSATLADLIVNNARGTETAEEIRQQIATLEQDGFLRLTDRTGHAVRVVNITLGQVNGLEDLPFAGFSESINDIETYFNIDENEAFHLYQAADIIVKRKFADRLEEILADLQGK